MRARCGTISPVMRNENAVALALSAGGAAGCSFVTVADRWCGAMHVLHEGCAQLSSVCLCVCGVGHAGRLGFRLAMLPQHQAYFMRPVPVVQL